MNTKNSGLSLPEVLVILTLITASLAVALPRFSSEKRKTRLEAEKITAFLQQAQALAFYKDKKVQIKIEQNRLTMLIPGKVSSVREKSLVLSEPHQVSNSSHNQIYFSPAGTGTPSNISISGLNYSCKITNSLFNRIRYYCS